MTLSRRSFLQLLGVTTTVVTVPSLWLPPGAGKLCTYADENTVQVERLPYIRLHDQKLVTGRIEWRTHWEPGLYRARVGADDRFWSAYIPYL
jgi:hypothetical protein